MVAREVNSGTNSNRSLDSVTKGPYKVMHYSDTHNVNRIKEAVGTALAYNKQEGLDAFFHTGDFIEGTVGEGGLVDRVLSNTIKDNIKSAAVELSQSYDGAETEDIMKAAQKYGLAKTAEELDITKIVNEIKAEYHDNAKELNKLVKEGVKVCVTLGNHDFKLAVDIFSQYGIEVVDYNKGTKLGDLTIKGVTNTYEMPALQQIMRGAMEIQKTYEDTYKDIFINYNAGHSLSELKENAKKGEKSPDLETMIAELEVNETKERERLGELNADILLTHKLPKNQHGTNDIVKNIEARTILGGHIHQPERYKNKKDPSIVELNPGNTGGYLLEIDAKTGHVNQDKIGYIPFQDYAKEMKKEQAANNNNNYAKEKKVTKKEA